MTLQISIFHHKKKNYYNSNIQYPIYLKLHIFNKTSTLNKSTYPYSIIIITPPTNNKKYQCFTLQITTPKNFITSTFYFNQSNLKFFTILNYKNLKFSLKNISITPSQNSISHHKNKNYYNSNIKYPILPKLHIFNKYPNLNTSKNQYSIKYNKIPR